MTADEALKKSQENLEKGREQALKEVMKAIDDACENGLTNCYIALSRAALYHSTYLIETLKSAGYGSAMHSNFSEQKLYVNWSK